MTLIVSHLDACGKGDPRNRCRTRRFRRSQKGQPTVPCAPSSYDLTVNIFVIYLVSMARARPAADPRSFLPLTPLAFQVLLALADAGLHGYAITRELGERTAGLVRLRTGTLYTLLQRLADEGLVEESDARPQPSEDDQRRRYYPGAGTGRPR